MTATRIISVSGLRGVVGQGLEPVSVTEYAAAYASLCGPGPIILGNDGRASAHVFTAAVSAGVTATGRDIMDAGPTATPTIGRLVRHRQASGGIQISASHNPPEYNGVKLFQPEGMVLDARGGHAVLERLTRREFGWAPWTALGKIHHLHNPDTEHLEAVLDLVDARSIRERRFGVVLDACHGAGGRMGAALLHALGCHATIVGEIPDGHYDHPPEPTREHLHTLCGLVTAESAHIGFAQDPDADRLAIIDEQGRYIGEEFTMALAAWCLLQRASGPVVTNLSSSRLIDDVAARFHAPVHRTPVGEIHVVDRMRAENAVVGGEGNGGVIVPSVGYVRDSFVGMALTLELMARTGQPLSRLVDSLPHYAMQKHKLSLPSDDEGPPVEVLLEQLAQAHPEARVDRRDGLRLDWDQAWAHVRISNTEPIMRIIAEAPDDALTTQVVADLRQHITGKSRKSPE